MFLPNSRYASTETTLVSGPAGRQVTALKLRSLPSVAGTPHPLSTHDQLDVLALHHVNDGTKSWAIADANTELDQRTLTELTGANLNLPAQG